MSGQEYDEVMRQVEALIEAETACKSEELYVGHIYTPDSFFDGRITSSELNGSALIGDDHLLCMTETSPSASDLFQRVRSHLSLPEHYHIRDVCYHPVHHFWMIDVECREEPYPEAGETYTAYYPHHMKDGVLQDWSRVNQIRCHGTGKGHKHEQATQ